MTYDDLKHKNIAIIGYGSEGQVLLRNFLKHGLKPVLFDHKPYSNWPEYKQKELKALNINFIFGPDSLKEMAGIDLAFKSPGLPLSHPDLQIWMKKGLEISSQTKFFFDNCPAKIIGVTGSQGKGTTATLIYEMLKLGLRAKGQLGQSNKVYLTGNIGKVQPLDFLEEISPEDFVIYELSSFQLQDLHKSPFLGVCLMVKSEHLNYHKTTEEYQEAKSSITKFQKKENFAVFNIDYEASQTIGLLGNGQKLEVSSKKEVEKGCFIKEETVYAKNLLSQEVVEIIKLKDTKLVGKHNLENIAAATTAVLALGCKIETVQHTLKNFKGLEHRLEFVGQKNNVRFYNDSVSTSPDAAIAAINAFTENLIIILGGASKNLDYSELVKKIENTPNIQAVILTGEEGKKIKAMLSSNNFEIFESSSKMQDIFKLLKTVLTKESVVLFSPGALSFDAYKNYSDRGEQFKNFVHQL